MKICSQQTRNAPSRASTRRSTPRPDSIKLDNDAPKRDRHAHRLFPDTQAATTIIEASTLMCRAPARAADESTLRDRLIFLRNHTSFRVRKFAADWVMVTQLVSVAVLVLLVAELIYHQPL